MLPQTRLVVEIDALVVGVVFVVFAEVFVAHDRAVGPAVKAVVRVNQTQPYDVACDKRTECLGTEVWYLTKQ